MSAPSLYIESTDSVIVMTQRKPLLLCDLPLADGKGSVLSTCDVWSAEGYTLQSLK